MIFDLSTLGLSPEQRAARRLAIGASEAPILVSGDPEKINKLAREKWGEADTDLSDELPAMLGLYTEKFNLAWYTKTTGRRVWGYQESLRSAAYSFMRCTLDGRTSAPNGAPAIIQAKHTNPFWSIKEVVAYYLPQVTHEMIVAEVQNAVLSVLVGNMKLEVIDLGLDAFYAAQLIDTERAFWKCVEERRLPHILEAPQKPDTLPITLMRTVDMMEGNRQGDWREFAEKWLEEEPYVKQRKTTDKHLKEMMPDDAREAFGAGIMIARNKAGSLTIKTMKEE